MNVIQDKVLLDEGSHVYYDEHGTFYDSVSSVIKRFTEPFDIDLVSLRVAKKKLRGTEYGDNIRVISATAKKIREEWLRGSEEAMKYGTRVHKMLEDYVKGGDIDPRFSFMKGMLRDRLMGYDRVLCESVLYHSRYRVAGTADLVKIRGNVVDIDDYKTNEKIDFSSLYRKKMLAPFSGYDDCSYWKYFFQQNLYMYMLVDEFGYDAGDINLINIPRGSDRYEVINIPVNLDEAKKMLDYYRGYIKLEEVIEGDKKSLIARR